MCQAKCRQTEKLKHLCCSWWHSPWCTDCLWDLKFNQCRIFYCNKKHHKLMFWKMIDEHIRCKKCANIVLGQKKLSTTMLLLFCCTCAYLFSYDRRSCYVFRLKAILSFSHLMMLICIVFITRIFYRWLCNLWNYSWFFAINGSFHLNMWYDSLSKWSGKKFKPTKWSQRILAQTFAENCHWSMWHEGRCLCMRVVVKMATLVKVHSFVNRMCAVKSGCTQWQLMTENVEEELNK